MKIEEFPKKIQCEELLRSKFHFNQINLWKWFIWNVIFLCIYCDFPWRNSGDFKIAGWVFEGIPIGRPTKWMWMFNNIIDETGLMETPLSSGKCSWSRLHKRFCWYRLRSKYNQQWSNIHLTANNFSLSSFGLLMIYLKLYSKIHLSMIS